MSETHTILDFWSMRKFVDTVNSAGPRELEEAIKDCRIMEADFELAASRRVIWKDLRVMLQTIKKRD